jgi:hypothetical protein
MVPLASGSGGRNLKGTCHHGRGRVVEGGVQLCPAQSRSEVDRCRVVVGLGVLVPLDDLQRPPLEAGEPNERLRKRQKALKKGG